MRRVEFTWHGGRVSYVKVTDEEVTAIINAFNAGNKFSMSINVGKPEAYTMWFNPANLVSLRVDDEVVEEDED